jgi:multicomponent Na+:H+ antiporter subunit E
LPPTPGSLRYGALLRLAARVLRNSVVSGFSLLPRVFGPRLSIAPGYVSYPVRLPPGPARAAFGALTSVVPGTLSVGTDRDGALIYHCLDVAQPVAEDLAIDEALLIETLGNKPDVQEASPRRNGEARA